MAVVSLPRELIIVKACDTWPTFSVSTTRATSVGRSFMLKRDFSEYDSSSMCDIRP